MIHNTMSGFMKKSLRALALVSILAVSSASAWADTTWYLEGVVFSDGATAGGSFTIDPTFTTLTAWEIPLAGSSSTPPADYDYNSGDSFFTASLSSTEIPFCANGGCPDVLLLFTTVAMTNAGGTISLDPSSLDCNVNFSCGTLVSGEISTDAPVPEPSSVLLFACGACILGFVLYRRKHALSA